MRWGPGDFETGQLAAVISSLYVRLSLQVLSALTPALAPENSIFMDCTVGCGGHACAVLAANPSIRLLGLDKDAEVCAGRVDL